MLDNVWLVPLCPLLGALLNGFFGRRYHHETVGQIAIAAVGVAFPRVPAPGWRCIILHIAYGAGAFLAACSI